MRSLESRDQTFDRQRFQVFRSPDSPDAAARPSLRVVLGGPRERPWRATWLPIRVLGAGQKHCASSGREPDMSLRIVLNSLATVGAFIGTTAYAGPILDEFRNGAFGLPWNATPTVIQAKYPNGKWDKDEDGVDRFCAPSRQLLLGLPAQHQTRELCFLIGGDGTMASATARMDATLPSLGAVVNRSRTRFGDFDAVKRDEGAVQSRFTYMIWTKDAPILVVVGSTNDSEGRPNTVEFTVADEALLYMAGAKKVSSKPTAIDKLPTDLNASRQVKTPQGRQPPPSSPDIPISPSKGQSSVIFVQMNSQQLADMRTAIWRQLMESPGVDLNPSPTSPDDIAVLPGVVRIRSDDGVTQTEFSVYAIVRQALRFNSDSNRFEGSIIVRAVESGHFATFESLPTPIVFQIAGAESDPSELRTIDSSYVTFNVFANKPGDKQTVHIVTNLGVEAFPLDIPVQRPLLTLTSQEQVLNGWGLETIEVKVTSSSGKHSSGQLVMLQLTSGDGAISPSATKLDSSGTASFRIRSAGTGWAELVATGQHFAPSNNVHLQYVFPIGTLMAAIVGGLGGGFLRRRDNPTRRRQISSNHIAGVVSGFICFALFVLGVNVTGYPLPGKAGEVLVFVVSAVGALLGTAALKAVRFVNTRFAAAD